jgi:hypothetical protein
MLLLLAGTAYAAVHKSNEYHKKTFGRQALVRAGGSAGVSHVRNAPHEWGRGGTGFAKRVGSSLGEHAVKNTIAYGVAGLRHEDLKYHRSGKHGFGPRLKTALASTVVTRKTTTGKRTVASGRLAGNVGSGMISRAWQPARLRTVSSGATTAGMMVGADATSNVVQEFWPEIRHPHRHARHVRHVRR